MASFFRRYLRETTLQAAFLVVTLGLASWLGYQGLVAATSHRRTAEAVLADYAGISAWEFSQTIRDNLGHMLEDIFRPVRRRMGRSLPGPEVVGRELDDAAHEQGCGCPAFSEPIALFRIERGPARVSVVPDTLSDAARGELRELIMAQPIGDGRVDRGLITAAAGTGFQSDVAIGFMIAHDTSDVVEAAYGFVVPLSAMQELFGGWHEQRQLLPEPIAGTQPNDSLLYVQVSDEKGLNLFSSPADTPDTWSAVDTIGPDFGGLTVKATVRPDAAGQLVIGGLPTARLPLLAILFVLTLGVGAAAFVQLRRQQQFQRLRDDFVSGVSHELRTPLAQIQIFSELQEAGKLASVADRTRANKVIRREAKRLSHLVDNILQFTRLGRTSGVVSPREAMDLAEACADGIDAVTTLLEDRDMRLEVEAEAELPIIANRDAVTRIVVNLLDNAVKYGPRGQTVKVTMAPSSGSARLTVDDEGPGIPANERQRVWRPYRRLNRELEGTVPGTGIGLAVVSQLVSLHDGQAWVEDADSGGARFIVELPMRENGGSATGR